MKKTLLSHLRDRNCSQKDFRFYSERLAEELAYELLDQLPKNEYSLSTPLEESQGVQLQGKQLLIPILRSGLVMLFPFLRLFHDAKVGFLGMKRNETTFMPDIYYEKVPHIEEKCQVIILDPMIATGGSSKKAVELLINQGAKEESLWIVCYLASPEGLQTIAEKYPKVQIIYGEKDRTLNSKRYILPGLGDFGDRYFME